MSIKVINDANNGTVIIKCAEVAGDYVVTTPAFTTELAPRMQLMTAQNSTSGTSIDFTGIPSWAKKITVMFNGVSTNGTSPVQIQLGDSGGVENTGYLGAGAGCASGVYPGITNNSAGFLTSNAGGPTQVRHGSIFLNNITLNTWTSNCNLGLSDGAIAQWGGGSKTLSSTLDRVRITTVNGTDTFDAGQINIMYEG